MKQKPLGILESTMPDNLHTVVLKNWLRSPLNINVDFEQNMTCWKKKFQRTGKERYYFKKSEIRWYEELQDT